MREETRYARLVLFVFLLVFWVVPAAAEVFVQCPCYQIDRNTGKPDPTRLKAHRTGALNVNNPDTRVSYAAYRPEIQAVECHDVFDVRGKYHENVACKQVSAGDGHAIMGDGNDIFQFGFHEVTGTPLDQVLNMVNDPAIPGGMRGAEALAPTYNMQAGQEWYVSLTNHSMFERPDLMDPHTIHNHGFPNASSVFDGEPMASISINMGETLTYYWKFWEPGTYMAHCHVEASEHMQMGMLGALNVRPQQDLGWVPDTALCPNANSAGCVGVGKRRVALPVTYNGKQFTNFAYNDCSPYVNNVLLPAGAQSNGCGSTGYSVSYPLEITAYDPKFHHNDNTYNTIDFAAMDDTYGLFNGRGYPYTINSCTAVDRNTGNLRQTALPAANYPGYPNWTYPAFLACSNDTMKGQLYNSILSVPAGCGGLNSDGTAPGDPCDTPVSSQNVSALITGKVGDKILIHFPSLATAEFNTVTLLGLPMQLVGQGAKQYRGPTGLVYYTNTQTITIGGGEGFDILIDTSNATPGTYFMYTTNLNRLNNNTQDYGGMMTEIVLTNAVGKAAVKHAKTSQTVH